MKNINQKTIIIILGVLLAACVLCCLFYFGNKNNMNKGGMMHSMGNGQMMNNSDMSMSDMMGSMNKSLEGKTGDEFDKAFIDEMVIHHEGAVSMANMVLKNSKRPELLQLAKEIIAAQTKEIDMMKSWKSAWFK